MCINATTSSILHNFPVNAKCKCIRRKYPLFHPPLPPCLLTPLPSTSAQSSNAPFVRFRSSPFAHSSPILIPNGDGFTQPKIHIGPSAITLLPRLSGYWNENLLNEYFMFGALLRELIIKCRPATCPIDVGNCFWCSDSDWLCLIRQFVWNVSSLIMFDVKNQILGIYISWEGMAWAVSIINETWVIWVYCYVSWIYIYNVTGSSGNSIVNRFMVFFLIIASDYFRGGGD